jgi:hypothetical protein
MMKTNSVVAIYNTHAQAEEAVKNLQKSGIDIKNCRSSERTITPKKMSRVTIT